MTHPHKDGAGLTSQHRQRAAALGILADLGGIKHELWNVDRDVGVEIIELPRPYLAGHEVGQALQHAPRTCSTGTGSNGLSLEATSHLMGELVRYEIGNVYNPAYTIVCLIEKKWLPNPLRMATGIAEWSSANYNPDAGCDNV